MEGFDKLFKLIKIPPPPVLPDPDNLRDTEGPLKARTIAERRCTGQALLVEDSSGSGSAVVQHDGGGEFIGWRGDQHRRLVQEHPDHLQTTTNASLAESLQGSRRLGVSNDFDQFLRHFKSFDCGSPVRDPRAVLPPETAAVPALRQCRRANR